MAGEGKDGKPYKAKSSTTRTSQPVEKLPNTAQARTKEEQPLATKGTQAQTILAGAISGVFSRSCVAPIDVVKIGVQLNTSNAKEARILGTIYKIWSRNGIWGFWYGNVPASLLYMGYSAVQFPIYHSVGRMLPASSPESFKSFVAGATAGAGATIATYPLDLLRTRFASRGNAKIYTGLLHSFKKIYETEGFGGFYRGARARIGQTLPQSGLFFMGYELLKPAMYFLDPSPDFVNSTAGMCASISSKTLMYPLDIVNKRLQIQGPMRQHFGSGNVPHYGGVVEAMKTIKRQEGIRGLYRGLSMSLIKSSPTSAITMWSYEKALKYLTEYHIAE